MGLRFSKSDNSIATFIARNPVYDSNAEAFITATGISGTNANAVNQLVLDLKAANIWTKMKAVYPMIGGTATAHKFNLINPADTDAAFRLNFVGGWTHSANGALPNGTNGYANTFLNTSTQLTLTSTHLSFYSRTLLRGSVVDMGCGQVVPPYGALELAVARIFYAGIEDSFYAPSFTTTTDARGFWLGSKRSNTDREVYLNGNSQATKTLSDTTAYPNLTLFLGAINRGTPNLYSAKECAFASIGDGLSDAEVANFYTAVQTFQTTLGRQL